MQHALQLRAWLVTAALLGVAWGGTTLARQDADEPARTTRQAQITRPWSQLDNLTSEQEREIRTIRRDILDRMAELRQEERDRIMAVLTEEQRDRIGEIERENRETARERARQRREGDADNDGGDQ